MEESREDVVKTEDEGNIVFLERGGRTFKIINHYTDGQTYTDIIKNALRRELETD